MKTITLTVSGILLCFFCFVSCKTTEKNYKNAYDIAVQKNKEGIDDDTYNKIKNESKAPVTVIGNDSVRLKTEFIKITDGNPDELKKYSIVVGQFKQVFNARSFRDRLKSNKYPAYVVENREATYYVIAHGFDTETEAAGYLKNIHQNIPFRLPVEEPWILVSPR